MFIPDAGEEIEMLVKKYHLSPGIQIFIEKLVNTRPEIQDALLNLIVETAAGIESIKKIGADVTSNYSSKESEKIIIEIPTEGMKEEEEYKKSRSDSASKTTLSASNIIEEKEKNA